MTKAKKINDIIICVEQTIASKEVYLKSILDRLDQYKSRGLLDDPTAISISVSSSFIQINIDELKLIVADLKNV